MPSKKKITFSQESIEIKPIYLIVTTVILGLLVGLNWYFYQPLSLDVKRLFMQVDFATYTNAYTRTKSESGKNLILNLAKNIWGEDVNSFQKQQEDKIYAKIRPLENFLKNQGPNAPIMRELALLYQELGKEKIATQYQNKANDIDPLFELYGKNNHKPASLSE